MASLRIGKRIPLRPSAQRSPSPDIGSKSIISHTTPPKISNTQILTKRDRDHSIIKIKEENKKLKEEMKYLLHKNKDITEDNIPFKNQHSSFRQTKPKSPNKQSGGNDRQTQKHSKKQITHTSSLQRNGLNSLDQSQASVFKIKQWMYDLIKGKEEEMNKKTQLLELRLRESQKTQRYLQQKIIEYNSNLRTSNRSNKHYNTTPIHTSPFDQLKQHQGSSASPNRYYTPTRYQQRSKKQIEQLQFQLSDAVSTIRRLETILQTQQKSLSQLKFQTQKKDHTISELKRQKQTLSKQLKSIGQHSDMQNSIKKSNKLIQQLQQKLLAKQQQLNNLKQLTNKQISVLKQRLKEYQSRKSSFIQNTDNQNKRSKQDHIKNELQQIIQDTQIRLGQMQQIIKSLEKELQSANKDKLSIQQELKSLKQNTDLKLKKSEELQNQNNALKQSIVKMKEQLQQIDNVNKKFNEQRAQFQVLASQLADTVKNLQNTKQQHRSQASDLLGQIKNIKSLAESVIIPDQQTFINEINIEHESIISRQKYQILELQKTIHSIQSFKQISQSHCRQLSQQNDILKEQIKSLQQSIQNYVKPVPREVIQREQIQNIILKQQIPVNQKIINVAKTINGVTTKLNRLCQEINTEDKNNN